MSKLKSSIQDVFDKCAKLYEEHGAIAVINHIDKVQYIGLDPVYKEIKYYYCDQCQALRPVLSEICLVCGCGVEVLRYGDEVKTMRQVRELIQDLDDDDVVRIEACDEHGDVEDLYPMSIDVIEGIELNDGSIVREVRFCQRPNTLPDDRNKKPVVNEVLKQIRIDSFYYGDESILEELLKLLPYEILINALPKNKIQKLRDFEKELKISTGLKDKDNNVIQEGDKI